MGGTDSQFLSVDDYINSQTPEAKEKLKELRNLIRINAPGAFETISYNMPAYKINGILLYFAAFKNHYSIFPGPKAILNFKKDLIDFKTSKGTIQFSYEKPVPKRLISNIIKYLVKENLEKKRKVKKLIVLGLKKIE